MKSSTIDRKWHRLKMFNNCSIRVPTYVLRGTELSTDASYVYGQILETIPSGRAKPPLKFGKDSKGDGTVLDRSLQGAKVWND